MKKILVTGGAGFISSNVVTLLIEKGYKVVVVDNLYSGSKRNVKKKAKFYKADITKLEKLKEIFKKDASVDIKILSIIKRAYKSN